MMRSVLSEGTGAAVRASGFSLDAAGKTGTTNDLRDAWFVGFTPELLTVVWVGLDDNQALGLSGAQAALPIWLAFMQRALAGRGDHPFEVPENISFVDIDRDTGATAIPGCLRVFSESFLAGTEPGSCVKYTGSRFAEFWGRFGVRRFRVRFVQIPRLSVHESPMNATVSPAYNRPHMSQEVFEALTQALERGEDAALVTIVSAQGSTPQRVGAKMLVFPDGRTVGTIGGGCYENDAFWKAKESIQSRKPASSSTTSTTTSRRKTDWCAAGRCRSTSSRSKRRRACT